MKRPENEVEAIEEIASEVYSWAESACADLAGMDELLADEYWEDPRVLSDIFGDRIYDECISRWGSKGEDWAAAYVCVCDQIIRDHKGHMAIVLAMADLKERRYKTA